MCTDSSSTASSQAGKGPDGLVYVTEKALQAYRDEQAQASR